MWYFSIGRPRGAGRPSGAAPLGLCFGGRLSGFAISGGSRVVARCRQPAFGARASGHAVRARRDRVNVTRKKILVLSHAGVLEVNRAVFQELARLEADVTMVVPREWKGDLIRGLRFEARDSDRSLRVIPLPVALSGKGSLFFYRSSLRRALAGWEPELVFLDEEPWSLAALQTYLQFPRAKVWFFTKENLDKTIPWPFSSLEQWVYRRAAGAFVVSHEVEQVLRGKGFRGGVQQLHHSYDPELFMARPESERQRIKDEFGIPHNALVIGYFGRLTAEKGLPDLTNALQLLSQEADLAPWYFSCVGNGLAEAGDQTSARFAAKRSSLSHARRTQPRSRRKVAGDRRHSRAAFAHHASLEGTVRPHSSRSHGLRRRGSRLRLRRNPALDRTLRRRARLSRRAGRRARGLPSPVIERHRAAREAPSPRSPLRRADADARDGGARACRKIARERPRPKLYSAEVASKLARPSWPRAWLPSLKTTDASVASRARKIASRGENADRLRIRAPSAMRPVVDDGGARHRAGSLERCKRAWTGSRCPLLARRSAPAVANPRCRRQRRPPLAIQPKLLRSRRFQRLGPQARDDQNVRFAEEVQAFVGADPADKLRLNAKPHRQLLAAGEPGPSPATVRCSARPNARWQRVAACTALAQPLPEVSRLQKSTRLRAWLGCGGSGSGMPPAGYGITCTSLSRMPCSTYTWRMYSLATTVAASPSKTFAGHAG